MLCKSHTQNEKKYECAWKKEVNMPVSGFLIATCNSLEGKN